MTLDEFVTGIIAVLAFRGRPRVLLAPGLFDVALAKTLELVAKQAQRERLALRFRIPAKAMERPSSRLWTTIRRLEAQGVIKRGADPNEAAEILWTKEMAYGYLARTPVPPHFLERSAKFFVRSLETARIRTSLHRLATRSRAKA